MAKFAGLSTQGQGVLRPGLTPWVSTNHGTGERMVTSMESPQSYMDCIFLWDIEYWGKMDIFLWDIGIFLWDISMGYFYGIFLWDISMGYHLAMTNSLPWKDPPCY